MTRTALCSLLLGIICTTQRIGPFTFTDCSDGTRITGETIGPFRFNDIQPPPHRVAPFVVPAPAPPADDDQGEDEGDE